MTDYTPAYVGTVTRYVVVESYTVTPCGCGDPGCTKWQMA